ncbi:MAG TPA: TerD family protein [Campylobacterales bacterium]|nr:TerD family protein [Campylobacterales bacterium]
MATINLVKGGRVNLSKEAPSLVRVGVALGWDINDTDTGYDFDLDVSIFMLNSNKKLPANEYFVFYNNLKSPDGAVEHTGDNLTGEGEGDDETIFIDLSKVSPEIEEILFVVTIYEADQRGQNFGQVRNSFIRLYNRDTNEEILKYELEEDFSTETALEFGRLYKKNDSWRFQAVGMGYKTGLQAFVDKYVP